MAEQAYFFRHAMLRAAAYELQTPSSRGRLHLLAMDAIESLAPGDEAAFELAGHAAAAAQAQDNAADLLEREEAYLRRACNFAEQRYDFARALACTRRRLELGVGPADETLHKLASLSFSVGDINGAETAIRAALELAADDDTRGRRLTTLASILRQTGRGPEAEAAFNDALAAHRRAGDRRTEGITLNNLAGHYLGTGRHELAMQTYEAALAAHRETGNLQSEGVTLNGIGSMYVESRQYDQARASLERALELLRAQGDRGYTAVALGNLAFLNVKLGEQTEAARCYIEALALAREVNNRRLEGVLVGNYAILLREQNRLPESAERFSQALAVHREMGNRQFEGIHQLEAALTAVAAGEIETARRLWAAGARLLRRSGDGAGMDARSAVMREACRNAGVPELPEG